MPFNILLLPLLGGYIFISSWNRTRFRALRLSGNKLILESAIAGTFFLVLSFSLTRVVRIFFPEFESLWLSAIPFEYSGTSATAFLIGATLWWPLNRVYKRDIESRRAIEESNDFLEIFLEKALRQSKQVTLTLKNGKVYIGFVSKMFDPSYERKYVTLLPTLSGYRNPQDQTLTITTDYYKVYLRAILEDNVLERVNDFEVLVPVSEVRTFKLYDPSAAELFDEAVV
jgi:hypothetical protein